MNEKIRIILSKDSNFQKKLESVCKSLGIQVEWLVAVIWNESRLRPYAKNPDSGAFGLIQFMPSTMLSMGISEALIRTKSATDQLVYVERYFQPYKGKMKNIYDVYSAVFFPIMMRKPLSYVLETAKLPASVYAKANPIFDLDKNLKITKYEFIKYIDDVLLPQVGIEIKKKVKS